MFELIFCLIWSQSQITTKQKTWQILMKTLMKTMMNEIPKKVMINTVHRKRKTKTKFQINSKLIKESVWIKAKNWSKSVLNQKKFLNTKADQIIRIGDQELSCRKSNDGFFYCEWTHCDKEYTLWEILSDTNSTVDGADKPFRCHYSDCGKEFVRKSVLNAHIATHTGEKRYACNWPQCQYRCITATSVETHKKFHTGETPYDC